MEIGEHCHVYRPIESSDYYERLSIEVLIALRGKLQQKELSKNLGFTFNQVGKWESGVTNINWRDFKSVCFTSKIPIDTIIREQFIWSSSPKDIYENKSIVAILMSFFGYDKLNDIAADFHKSKPVFSRWLNSKIEPSLAEVLQIIDLKPFLLVHWLRSVLGKDLELLRQKIEFEKTVLSGLLSHPVAALVNACLHLEEYKLMKEHSSAWMANKISEPKDQIENALLNLVTFGIIEFKNGKYKSYFSSLSTYKVSGLRVLTKHLTKKMGMLFDSKQPRIPNFERPSMSSTSLHPLSNEASLKMVEVIAKFHRDINQIAKEDSGIKTHVRAIVLHSVDCENTK